MAACDFPPGELPRATPTRALRWQAVAELLANSTEPVRRVDIKNLLGSGRSRMRATLDQLCKAQLIHIEGGNITLTERGRARLLTPTGKPCIRASIRDQ